MDHQQQIANLERRRAELSQELESASADVKLSLIGKKAKATDIAVAAQTRQSALSQIVEGIDGEIEIKRAEFSSSQAIEARADLLARLAQCASDAKATARELEEARVGVDDILAKMCFYMVRQEQAILAARSEFLSILEKLIPNFRRWERLMPTEAAEVTRATDRILGELASRGVDASVVRYDGWQPGASPADLQKYPLNSLSGLRFGEAIKIAITIASRFHAGPDGPKAA